MTIPSTSAVITILSGEKAVTDDRSPLDVPSVNLSKSLSKDEIVSLVREGRERNASAD